MNALKTNVDVPNGDLRKAAILVASLDAELADRVLSKLPAQQAELVRRVLPALGQVSAKEHDGTIVEFFRLRPVHSVGITTGVQLDATLLERMDGSSTPSAWSQIDGPQVDGPQVDDKRENDVRSEFDFLAQTDPRDLAELLANERPQTIAVVLSHLDAEQAAQVLPRLVPSLQADAVDRLTRLDEIDPASVRAVGAQLKVWFRERARSGRSDEAGVATARRILDSMASSQRNAVLANLDRHAAPLAGRLKRTDSASAAQPCRAAQVAKEPMPRQTSPSALTKTTGSSPSPAPPPSPPPSPPPPAHVQFAELATWDSESLATILGRVAPEVVVLALAGADESLVHRVAALLPQHEAAKLDREIVSLGPTRLRDVETAQRRIAETASQLLGEEVFAEPQSAG